MRDRRIIVIPLLIAVIFTGQLSQAEAQSYTPFLQVSADDIYLVAGQENRIEIKLKNTGDFKVFEVEAILTSSTTGLSVLTDAHMVYNEIQDGRTKTYNPTIYVDPELSLGSYTLSLQVSYQKMYKFGVDDPSQIVVPIGVIVSKGFIPGLKLNPQQENTIKAGSQRAVGFNIDNNRNDTLIDLEFTLSSASTFITILDGISYAFNEMKANETLTLSPTLQVLDSAPLGPYSLTAIASYMDEGQNRYHQTFTLPLSLTSVEVSSATSLTVKEMGVRQGSVHPGDVFDLEIEIECSGAEANDVMVTISFDAGGAISPITPTTTSLGDMEPGETTSVQYQLLAGGDIGAGQYPVTVTLGYTDSQGVPGTLVETLTVLVEGIVEFELLEAPVLSIERGGRAEIEADLLLIGTESVQFMSVEVVEGSVFRRVTGGEEYIGAVDPDSPIPFDLDVGVAEDAPVGEHALTLKVTYRDHLNQEHEVKLEMDVSVTEATELFENPQGPFGGLWLWIRRFLGLTP
jgi:hypothetical protein